MTPTYSGKEYLFTCVKSIYSASSALVYFIYAVYFTTGCSVDAVAFSNAYFGEHSSPGTNLTNLRCYGNESRLTDCRHSTTTTCRVYQVAGVRCQGRTVAGIKLCSVIHYQLHSYIYYMDYYYMKGSEPEWTNPKSSTGNCMNCAKMQ